MSHEGSKLSPHQISQALFDEDKVATRVHLVDADLAIELDAEDGDSVITVKRTQLVEVNPNDIMDFSLLSELCVYVSDASIQILDYDDNVMAQCALPHGTPVQCMAVKVKFLCSAPLKVLVR